MTASENRDGRNVEDPHPGSISDGTHPAAAERKPPQPEPAVDRQEAGKDAVPSSRRDGLKEQGTERLNTVAPQHPTRSAHGS